MDKPKKLVCPFEWSRQESEHRSRYFCQRQNTIPAHTFFDNYCCGLGRIANIVRDASVKDRTRFLRIHLLITIVVESTDIFSNSFMKDLEVLSALRLHICDGTKA